MDKSPYKDNYISQFDNLIVIIKTANQKMIAEPRDSFIYENANFFSKSFLVVMCAYLESYLKDVLMLVVDQMNIRLKENRIPYNLVKWSLNLEKELKDGDLKFENLKISIKRKELDDFISGNPYKTKTLFKKFGIDLESDKVFNRQKENINLIVVKRNKVLHHNDDASDISNLDIIRYIEEIRNYLENIDLLVCKHIA